MPKPPDIQFVDSWDSVAGDSGPAFPEMRRIDPVERSKRSINWWRRRLHREPNTDQAVAVAERSASCKHNWREAYGQPARRRRPELFEQLWERWPDEHRFGVQLLHCYLAAERVRRAREERSIGSSKQSEICRRSGRAIQKAGRGS